MITAWPHSKTTLRQHNRRVTQANSVAIVAPNNRYTPYSIIVETPGTCGGEPRIDGTRLSVRVIADTYWQGAAIETIADIYDVERWQVEQAIEYANKNKETIKRLIVENDTA